MSKKRRSIIRAAHAAKNAPVVFLKKSGVVIVALSPSSAGMYAAYEDTASRLPSLLLSSEVLSELAAAVSALPPGRRFLEVSGRGRIVGGALAQFLSLSDPAKIELKRAIRRSMGIGVLLGTKSG